MSSGDREAGGTEGSTGEGNRTRNYVAGLSSGYLFTFASIVVGLFLTPFILRYLDAEEYAIYALAGDLLLWLTLLDLGIGSGLKVKAATLQLDRGSEELNRLTSAAVAAQLFTATATLSAGALIAWALPYAFDVRADLLADARLTVILLAIGTGMTLSIQPFSAVLVARQRIYVENLLRMSRVFLRAIGTVVLLVAGLGLLALPIANLISSAVTSTMTIGYARRAVPTLRVGISHFSWDTLRSITGLGVWLSLGSLAGLAIQHLDRIVAGKVVGLVMVTTLTLSGRLYVLCFAVLQQLVNNARPMMGQLLGQARRREALAVYHQLFALSSGGALVVAAAIWAGNDRFVAWWVGAENYGGLPLDLALAVNLAVHCWVLPNRALLAADLIVRSQTLGRIAEGVLNLGLSVLLGLRYGLAGVAAGTAIAAVLTSCWYLPWLTARRFEVSFRHLMWTDLSRLAVMLAGVAPIAWAARHWSGGIEGLPGVVVAMGSAGAAGALLLWFVGLDDPTRARIRAVLRSVWMTPWVSPAMAARRKG